MRLNTRLETCRLAVAGLLCAAALTACGGSVGGNPTIPGPEVDGGSCSSLTPPGLFRGMEQALTDNAARCGALAPGLESAAAKAIHAKVAATADGLDAAIAAGTVTYDAARACQCLADFRKEVASCGPPRAPASCYAAIVGKVPTGQDCDTRIDTCADGYCAEPYGGDQPSTCQGMCKAWDEAGDSCYSGDCRPGLRCSGGKCTASGPGKTGAPCSIDGDCVASDYCASGHACKPRAGAKASCAYDNFLGRNYDGTYDGVFSAYGPACAPGLACSGSVDFGGVTLGTCQKPSGVGGPCTDPNPTFVSDSITGCEKGLVCNKGVCQLPASDTCSPPAICPNASSASCGLLQ